MRMGKLGEEVSQKIKSAIKAKLMELGIHIDNELPDYVMVLVANKKTQKQMEDDLLLFLGENTKVFTSWLHDVLRKLEKVTVSAKNARRKLEEKKIKSRRSSESDGNEIITKKFKSSQIKLDDDKLVHNNESNGTTVSPTASKGAELANQISDLSTSCLSDYTHPLLWDSKENVLQSEKTSIDNIEEKTISKEFPVPKDYCHVEKEEVKQRERIKIVWEDDNKEQSSALKHNRKGSDVEIKREDRSRSKSRDRAKRKEKRYDYKDKKSSLRTRDSKYKRRSRSRSPKNYEKRYEEDVQPVKRVQDARDILRKKGLPNERKHNNEHRSRKREATPLKKSADKTVNKDKILSSVLITKEPEKPTLPSMVKVTPRPSRPQGMQPSCNLILRAVADAEKSVATSKVNQKLIEGDLEENTMQRRRHFEYAIQGNISVTLLNDRISSTKEENICLPKEEPIDDEADSYNFMEADNIKTEDDTISMVIDSEDYIESLDSQDCISSNELMKSAQTIKPKRDNTASDNELENEPDSTITNDLEVDENQLESIMEKESITTHQVKQPFDRSRLGPKVVPQSQSGPDVLKNGSPPLDILNLEFENLEINKNQTRCKFWPGCEAGSVCPYYHPTTLCRMFPTCAFGDKCLYIHPACKFADQCLNKKCPYTHRSVTPVQKGPSRGSLPITSPVSTQLCMYYPKCTKPFCPFLHVKKPCRFGATCVKVGCEFYHRGNKNPYKWVANS